MCRELIALQGPKAAEALSQHLPKSADLSKLPFLYSANLEVAGVNCIVSRCGYTGEDGFEVRDAKRRAAQRSAGHDQFAALPLGALRNVFEADIRIAPLHLLLQLSLILSQISIPKSETTRIFNVLLATPNVLPAALGVRDSLRLESGMCLYGHDLNETITPIEASLNWLISKRRREAGGFPGADVIQKQLKEGVTRSVACAKRWWIARVWSARDPACLSARSGCL